MQRCYLVCYDIHSPARWRRVYRIMKGYGEPWQLSVFFCVLKDIDKVRLRSDLEKVMNLKEDQLLIVRLEMDEEHSREATVVIGQALPELESGTVVI